MKKTKVISFDMHANWFTIQIQNKQTISES